MTHWHVTRHNDDDDPVIFSDVYQALDYAATELSQLADFEFEGIRPAGESGDYQGAYEAWVKSEQYNALYLAAKHAPQQHGKARKDRAPLYAEPDFNFGEPVYVDDNHKHSRLYHTAEHHAEEINFNSPVTIWYCEGELKLVRDLEDYFTTNDDEEATACTTMGGTGHILETT